MVLCANCGEEDFYQQEGFFFCSVCQTQSQQVREEGLEKDYDGQNDGSDSELVRPSKTKGKRQRDKGRIWMLEEGFTVILKKQVDSLIKRGAKPELKDKVFKLWMHYLKTNKVAFCKEAKWLTNEHARNYRTAHKKRKIELKSRLKGRKNEDSSSDESGEEEFYKGDNPDGDSSEDEYCLNLDDYGQRNTNAPQWMTVRKTVAFLYLGLLYSGHNVTIVDLIRWAKEEVYPLKDTSTCLNPDMKFIERGNEMSAVFRQKALAPSVDMVRQQCGSIATHLGLDVIPHPDMKQLVASYVVRLALPGELHGSVRYLMEELPTQFKPHGGSRLVNYDVIAIAYIVIALKLLLGFDDFRERQLSSYARELTKKLQLRQKLFIWDDWVVMHEKRRKRFKQNEYPKNLRDASEITDIGKFVEMHKGVMMNHMEIQYGARVAQKRDFQKAVAKPLESLLSTIPDPPDVARSAEPESDRLFSETFSEDFIPPGGNGQKALKTITPVLTEEELAFSATTLRYISEGVDFLEHLGNHGITGATLSSVYDMEESDNMATAAETAQVIAAIRQAVLLGLSTDREIIDPDDPLTLLSQRLSLKKDCYMIYNFGNVTWHTAYQWLLNLCAEMIYVVPVDIQNQVRGIEMILFKVSTKNSCVQHHMLKQQAKLFDTEIVMQILETETLAAAEDAYIPPLEDSEEEEEED